jgi:ribulose-5-phosphate 4-epimerase/fuculose-1-phosphate aldolase
MLTDLNDAVQLVVAAAMRIDARDVVPAMSGSVSVRMRDGRIVITAAERDKNCTGPQDVTVVDSVGVAIGRKTPSAATPLHASLYRLYPHANAVIVFEGSELLQVPACLIRGRGVCAWGKDMEEAECMINALEPLLRRFWQQQCRTRQSNLR